MGGQISWPSNIADQPDSLLLTIILFQETVDCGQCVSTPPPLLFFFFLISYSLLKVDEGVEKWKRCNREKA